MEDEARLTRIAAELALRAREDLDRVEHTVQVTSFGGSGSTALLEHLAAQGVDVQRTPGGFPFKHQRIPQTEVPLGFRVVYVVGDPRDAALSIFRRGFALGHYRAMWRHEPPPGVKQRLASLDNFLVSGIDWFGFGDHVETWLNWQRYPVLVVHYEQFAAAWPQVRRFVGLDETVPCFEVRPRSSRWFDLPAGDRDRLCAIYDDLADRIGFTRFSL